MAKNSGVIYGFRSVVETIKSGQPIERVFLRKNLKGDLLRELMRHIRESNIPFSRVPVERINRLTRQNHQGVVARVSPVRYHHLDYLIPSLYERGETPLMVILDGITDVRNFGAIARTCECLGGHGMVIPVRGGAQINEDAVQASAGALYHLPVCREENMLKSLRYLKGSGIQLIACWEKGDRLLHRLDYTLPSAIIMGSEDSGISRDLLSEVDECARVPMLGTIGSLNVSVAAGMILYEARRQRN